MFTRYWCTHFCDSQLFALVTKIIFGSAECVKNVFVLNLDTINLMHHETGDCKMVKGE